MREAIKYDEGFVFNVCSGFLTPQDISANVRRFNNYFRNNLNVKLNVEVLDEELMIPKIDLTSIIDAEEMSFPAPRFFVTRDLLGALNHVRFKSGTDVVLVICDNPMDMDVIKNVIRTYAAKFALKIVFFTSLADESFSDFKPIDDYMTFQWDKSKEDFAVVGNPVGLKVKLFTDDMMLSIKYRLAEIVEDVNKIVNNELVRSLIQKKWNAINDHETGDKEKVEKEDV